MHRSYVAPLALATVLTTAIVACTDDSRPTPTQPEVRAELSAAKPSAGACDGDLEKQIYSQINSLFASSVQTQARTLFGYVVTACPSGPAAAIPPLLTYVQFTIDQYRLGNVVAPSKTYATREDALVDNWEFGFKYVYNNNTQYLPVPDFSPEVLRASGGAKVIDATSADGYLVNNSWTAGFLIPNQDDAKGVTGPRLATITPTDPNCLTTNLQQPTNVCFHFSLDPKATKPFTPQATFGLCEATAVPANHVLAHWTGSKTLLTYKVRVPFDGIAYPEHLCEPHTTPSPYAFSDGLGTATRYALSRAASTALEFLSPRPLYATHTSGIGGSGTGISPFSPVMSYIFNATFSPPTNTAGFPPSPTADIGIFDIIDAQPPGSILVQSSLGNLTDQPVVLTQAGGNCDPQCGGLTLRGRVTTFDNSQDATYGSYSVSWQSLQARPTLKAAPFVIRDALFNEIATVAYEVRNNRPVLTYKVRNVNNGNISTIVVGAWTQNEAQLFQVVVNLDTKTTTLWINGVVTSAADIPFVVPVAGTQTLRYVAAEFTGIDAGIIGWDNIRVTRQYDEANPSGSVLPPQQ